MQLTMVINPLTILMNWSVVGAKLIEFLTYIIRIDPDSGERLYIKTKKTERNSPNL
jgi:hypothetical protein